MNNTVFFIVFLCSFYFIDCAKHIVWDNQAANDWSPNYFSGNGQAPNGQEEYKKTQSIYFQVIEWGGLSIFHTYTYVDVSPYRYLDFEFYWDDNVSNYSFVVSLKQQGSNGDVWSSGLYFYNMNVSQWNPIKIPLSNFNLTSTQINQIQIEKLDLNAVDAWISKVYFTDGSDFIDPADGPVPAGYIPEGEPSDYNSRSVTSASVSILTTSIGIWLVSLGLALFIYL